MRRYLLFSLLLLVASVAYAQTYNNEWIDYSKTYYKFKIATDGIYRISQGILASYGMAGFDAGDYQLWRNGVQVPIYTSSASGALAGDGYIEFDAHMNDGKPDKVLYRVQTDQPSDKYSLFTDSATYFLTLGPGENNLRYTTVANNVSGNKLKAEAYGMVTSSTYYKVLGNGYANTSLSSAIYSSSYDFAEGFTSAYKTAPDSFSVSYSSLNVNTGPTCSLKVGVVGNGSANSRTFHLLLNGTEVQSASSSGNQVMTISAANIASSLVSASSAVVRLKDETVATADSYALTFIEFTYPRKFTSVTSKRYAFVLPASDTGNYLQFSNVTSNGVAPVLYDLTNGLRIVGDISTTNTVKVVLPPSSVSRNLVLVSQESAYIGQVVNLEERLFVNYAKTTNQGNYLIVSHASLRNTDGVDYVEQYRQYRSSSAGGGYVAKIVDVNDLVDQFAFGMKSNPMAVKNFLTYARNTFSIKPQFVFLIGRGVNYSDYRSVQATAGGAKMALVPTFGWPASDLLMAAEKNDFGQTAFTPIGRLSAVTGTEVGNYLEKVKVYEEVQQTTTGSISDQSWKKEVIHVVGADDYLGDILQSYLDSYAGIAADTAYGAHVYSFRKNSTTSTEVVSSDYIRSLFEAGVGLVTYFGHSSSTTLAYNLDDPSKYDNKGKYPIFIIDGCEAGDVFSGDSSRLGNNYAISEKYVFAKQGGGVACLGSSYLGITNYLDVVTSSFYKRFCMTNYGSTIGEQISKVILDLGYGSYGQTDFLGRSTIEQVVLQGDPALRMYNFAKPDYAIEDPQVKIDPSFISVADLKYSVTAKVYNLGRATADSVGVVIKRKSPQDGTTELFHKKLAPISYADSVVLSVAIVANKDKGENELTVTLDPDNVVDELQESNNTVTKSFYIYDQEVRPLSPTNFSIQGKSPIKFYASTADALDSLRNFMIQVDTTELFNSAARVDQVATSKGGMISWNPPITLKDSVVYYWRVAIIPKTGDYVWSSASFVYISGASPGWNQSHYFQYTHDTYSNTQIGTNRKFSFDSVEHQLLFHNMLYPAGGNEGIYVSKDGTIMSSGECGNNLNSVAFFVFDEAKGLPMSNAVTSSGGGLYGSLNNDCIATKPYWFEFYYNSASYRAAAMKFIDSIPVGKSFAIWNWGSTGYNSNPQFINTWMSDTLSQQGNSLYNKFKSMGFLAIDSFYHNVPFLFVAKKLANGTFKVYCQKAGTTGQDLMEYTYTYQSSLNTGSFSSPYIGPASSWSSINWAGTVDNAADSSSVNVYGVKSDLTEDLLYVNNSLKKDTVLDFINATTYPKLRLEVHATDTALLTPYQLKRWQVVYKEIPEGAVAPGLYFNFKDTLDVGESLNLGMAFSNVSNSKFDSLKVKLTITDQQNVAHDITVARLRPLAGGDTLNIHEVIDTKNYAGLNTLYMNVNPDNDQPEQYTYNNFIYKNFYVKSDTYQPTLDVTFDGLHILNKDIVSSKPMIVIKMEDNSKYLALSDTSLFNVQVRYPDGTLHTYQFGTDTIQFIPANLSTGENSAVVIVKPYFAQDGDYELLVTGKDVSSNNAGRVSYDITFRVYNKPMISNLLNYPNPFTTSTAFVFTITGSEIPQMLRIQILTITGKIIREINRQELGALHIGRNITDFKWNGTDQFGQKVANGVYLYRVITNLNGKSMGKFTDSGDNTDQYFKAGYGKMYLMR